MSRTHRAEKTGRLNAPRQARMMNEWNKKHKEGTTVAYTRKDGTTLDDFADGEAYMKRGTVAMLPLRNLGESVELDRIRPLLVPANAECASAE